jgi:hypothetical protein
MVLRPPSNPISSVFICPHIPPAIPCAPDPNTFIHSTRLSACTLASCSRTSLEWAEFAEKRQILGITLWRTCSHHPGRLWSICTGKTLDVGVCKLVHTTYSVLQRMRIHYPQVTRGEEMRSEPKSIRLLVSCTPCLGLNFMLSPRKRSWPSSCN